MRIVYIITRMDELGGPQIHIRDFSVRLKSMGHEVYVITGSSGAIPEFLKNQNIPCTVIPEMTRSIGFWREFIALVKVYKTLRTINPDIVSCHSSKAGVIGRLAAFLARKPVIFTVHGWAFTENVPTLKRKIYQIIERVLAHFCDRIIAVSSYDRTLGLCAHVASEQKIVTIHNGMLDYPRRRVPAPDQNVRLIMVARFAEQKDHKTLVSAMALIRHLPWVLSLAGNGDTSLVQEQIKSLGLQNRIMVLGQRSDIGDLLNASDVFLLITHWEGFPRSIVEAMRGGLPVVATSVAGVPESVRDGETGYLVPHEDPQAVAHAIANLIQNPAQRAEMGRQARDYYEKNFTFEHMFSKTCHVYEQITGLRVYPQTVDKPEADSQAA